MDKVKLLIAGLQYSQTQTGAYALILEEEEGNRRLPIIIGSGEAQAIAVELEGMKTTRPLTHDLFCTFAKEFAIEVEEAVIYNFVDGVFYGKIVCSDGARQSDIDCRPSDAVALAVRFLCPIYTHSFILDAAGFERDADGDAVTPLLDSGGDARAVENEFTLKTEEELDQLLSEAIENEDYETASHIRDEMQRRNSN